MSNVKVSVSTGAPVPTSTPDAVDHIVAQWQREMPALASENMILFGRLKRCTALLQARLEAVFAEHGLNTASFDVLATLRRAGKPYSLTPTALFESLMVTSGTMTNRLQRLEEKGLIRRLPNPEDARSQLVQLTPQGKALIEQAVVPHVENEGTVLDQLPPRTRQQLEDGLKTLMRVLKGSIHPNEPLLRAHACRMEKGLEGAGVSGGRWPFRA